MEISNLSNKKNEDIKEVEKRILSKYEVVDIKVECPNCGLDYIEFANCDDDWHYIECDRCGTKYKYRYNW